MGLKSDIYDALEKNIGKEHIKNSPEGKAKVDTLADDLSIAIRDFILAQTFRVDKLTASTDAASTLIGETLIAPAHTVGPPGPHTIPPIKIPPIDVGLITVEVDKDGQGSGNPVDGGLPQSNYSEVRLRKSEVKEM